MNRKKLQMQRRHVRLGKLRDDIVFDQSGAPICPTCLSSMHPVWAVGLFGIFAPDGKDSETTMTYRCSACQIEVDIEF